MSREVMKLALEALYENTQYSMRGDPIAYQDQRNDDIIKAIKEALAQPEPVAWMPKTWTERYVSGVGAVTCNLIPTAGWVPLYASPPQRQPLTDEQINEIVDAHTTDDGQGYNIWCDGRGVARAIEAKLKEET